MPEMIPEKEAIAYCRRLLLAKQHWLFLAWEPGTPLKEIERRFFRKKEDSELVIMPAPPPFIHLCLFFGRKAACPIDELAEFMKWNKESEYYQVLATNQREVIPLSWNEAESTMAVRYLDAICFPKEEQKNGKH